MRLSARSHMSSGRLRSLSASFRRVWCIDQHFIWRAQVQPASLVISEICTNRILGFRESSSFSRDDTFLESLRTVTKSATTSLKESVKSTLLEEAIREDSRLWQTNASSTRAGTNENNHHPHAHYVNGHGKVNGAASIQHQFTPSGSVNETTLEQVRTTTSDSSLDDPLNDLYVPNAKSRYWPNLPSQVAEQEADSSDPFVLTKTELGNLSKSIREDLIRTDHPVLNRAAAYFFEAAADGGKKVRPMMVMLLSRALADAMDPSHPSKANSSSPLSTTDTSLFTAPMTWQRSDLPETQRRLAEISEMIHTASLFHDDVIDGADTRRGVPSVHAVFGNKMAILAGDYLLARASICLARLRNVQVVETMSTIIEHLVRGEVMQIKGTSSSSTNKATTDNESTDRIVYYLRKNFYKTGSLMANSCRSAALLGDYPPELVSASYRFGKHVGMAFQLVDDCLDFEGSLASLGKPALADLQAGLATAPVLFAAQEQSRNQAETGSESLWTLVDRKFKEPGDVDQALAMVRASSTAMEQTKELARFHAEAAMDSLLQAMPHPSPYRDALIRLAFKVVSRTK